MRRSRPASEVVWTWCPSPGWVDEKGVRRSSTGARSLFRMVRYIYRMTILVSDFVLKVTRKSIRARLPVDSMTAVRSPLVGELHETQYLADVLKTKTKLPFHELSTKL